MQRLAESRTGNIDPDQQFLFAVKGVMVVVQRALFRTRVSNGRIFGLEVDADQEQRFALVR